MYGKMQMSNQIRDVSSDFLLTNEWFGCGYIAYREILVSNRIARLFIEKKWRGVRLKAIDIVD
jgi:hypothetical protein